MAIIYSYTTVVPKVIDKLIITQTYDADDEAPVEGNPTRSAAISDIVALVPQPFVFNTVSLKGIQSATNTASGVNPVEPNGSSFSVGFGNVSSGGAATTIGSLNVASANNSFAGGLSTLASGLRSFAMGGSTIASGFMSAAFGFETVASGTRSFAFGDNTTASGEFSLAHGKGSIASGNYSTTMGVLTVASGERSFAIGDETTASGDFSVSFGKDTTAGAYGQTVIGQSNTIIAGENSTVFSPTTRAFVIGNGTVSNPADAFTVKYNGNTTVHGRLSVGKSVLTSNPLQELEVHGEAMFKSTDGENRVLIGNEGDAPNDSGLIELYDETGALDIKLVGKGNSFIKTGRLGLGFDTLPSYQLEVNSGTADVVAGFKSTDSKAVIMVSDVNTTASIIALGGLAYFGGGTTSSSIAVDNSGALGISTNAIHSSALLEIDSTTQGFLPPRMTTTKILQIVTPAEGLTVYNTTLKTLSLYDGAAWDTVVTENSGGISRLVDLTTQQSISGYKTFTSGLKVDGTIDLNSTGNSVFIGRDAGLNDDGTANENVGVGFNALLSNTSGANNTANGANALGSNTTGGNNTANGSSALVSNTTGGNNTATGGFALFDNTTGFYNVANGAQALRHNTTGDDNVAVGYLALFSNTTGGANVANGYTAMQYNTTGGINTANGSYTLQRNTTGNSNTANGSQALYYNTTGNSNTASGYRAGRYTNSGGNNEASSNSVYIGDFTSSLASGDINEIVIGSAAEGNGSNTARIGDANVTALYVGGNGAGVVLNSPNGTAYKITVSDAGAITATAI